MREFFIDSFEGIVSVLVVLMGIGVLVAGLAAMFGPGGGFWRGLFVLIGGGVYVMLIGGAMFLALGIYHNTKRTAEAIEALKRT